MVSNSIRAGRDAIEAPFTPCPERLDQAKSLRAPVGSLSVGARHERSIAQGGGNSPQDHQGACFEGMRYCC